MLSVLQVEAVRERALEKIHACGVTHGDARLADLRVEMRGERLEYVW